MLESEFLTSNHLQEVKEERSEGKNWDDVNNAKLEVIIKYLETLYRCLFLCAK